MEQKKYIMQIQLLSETLIGAAAGYGAIIDKDSVFDEVGLPVIPGKRIKGILKEQAELLSQNCHLLGNIETLFGYAGNTDKNTEYLSVSTFTMPDYKANKEYLNLLIKNKKLTRSEVISYFTCLRMMTSIDKDGIASDTSLRTFRVLNKGLVFNGELIIDLDYINDFKNIISLTRRIGSMRNRGLGHIHCQLIESIISTDKPIKKLEV